VTQCFDLLRLGTGRRRGDGEYAFLLTELFNRATEGERIAALSAHLQRTAGGTRVEDQDPLLRRNRGYRIS